MISLGEHAALMKTFSIILWFLEMFTRIVYEIIDILPSTKICVGAKGFKILWILPVEGMDKFDSSQCKSRRKYDQWCKSSHDISTPFIASRIASSYGKTISMQHIKF